MADDNACRLIIVRQGEYCIQMNQSSDQLFSLECTPEIVAEMIAHKASVGSKIILSHIHNIYLNTTIIFYII